MDMDPVTFVLSNQIVIDPTSHVPCNSKGWRKPHQVGRTTPVAIKFKKLIQYDAWV